MMFGRKQISGDDSTNVQVHRDLVVNSGVSAVEVVEICTAITRQNLLVLSEQTMVVVEARLDKFFTALVDGLSARPDVDFQSLKDPDIQYALISAGRTYVRSGDEEQGEVLINLLLDRCAQPDRNLEAIILNEAISIAGRLTNAEIAALAVVFQLRFSKIIGVTSVEELQNAFMSEVVPFVSRLSRIQASYRLLQGIGCADISLGKFTFGRVLTANYPGIFNWGFLPEAPSRELVAHIDNPDIFRPSLHRPENKQVNAVDAEEARIVAFRNGIPALADELVSLLGSQLLEEHEATALFVGDSDELRDLVNIWSTTPLQQLEITSPGIALGHAECRRVTGFKPNLSVWLTI